MIYKYELACKEAGLSEEQTAAIRRFLDNEKDKVAHEKALREKNGIAFSYSSISEDKSDEYGDGDDMDFVDREFDLEELIIHKMELEKLDSCLAELSADDREFLLTVFSGRGGAQRYVETHKTSKASVARRKKRLLEQLREKFFEKI